MGLIDELYYSFDNKPIENTVIFKLTDGTTITLDTKYYGYGIGVAVESGLMIIDKYDLTPKENGNWKVLETVTVPVENIVYYVERYGESL